MSRRPAHDPDPQPDPTLHVRIDKWLWAARFFKTRELAAKACELSRIRSNGQPAKAAREVKLGDSLSITNASGLFEVEVLGLSDQRTAAPIAAALYRESEASREARRLVQESRKLLDPMDLPPRTKPSKRDRRLIHRFRND